MATGCLLSPHQCQRREHWNREEGPGEPPIDTYISSMIVNTIVLLEEMKGVVVQYEYTGLVSNSSCAISIECQ